ncbi:uncharacterized protein LOC143044296 isoform X1 [Mytilus galloprovincialis]|uniref:uncharacterized protein LOC143044296 isoform X1 n=1 Tax=Mytilus galloprovincialis TaxID=29158 RepID=UPI003F7C98DE
MACPSTSVGYIFLMGTECLCIPKKLFTSTFSSYSEERTNTCTIHCQGSDEDLCGGVSSDVGKELYSAYEIVLRKISPGMQLGNTCASAVLNNTDTRHRYKYTRCGASLSYVCKGYNKTSKRYYEDCNSEAASWYDARHNCHNKGLILTSSIEHWCPGTQNWVGTHVTERIIWGNVSLPENALCLMLVIDGSEVTLETENCDNELYSLCYTSNEQGSTEATIKPSTISTGRTTYGSSINTKSDLDVENTKEIGRTTLRGPLNAESDSDENKPDFIPIIAGSVGGFVALVIVVIIVFIIQRRKKSNNKHVDTAFNQGEPDTYSEPIKNTVPEESRKLVVENTIPEENTKLVNVTEEGIYNHLGDSDKMIEMKPQDSSIYDITGDDEYHVFTGTGKQTIKDDDDLYDHGATSDVYNTLNDTVTPNRPESDTYNVINAK